MWRSRIKDQRGQALVEMALVLPILILVVFGIIEFGRIYTYQLQINSVARQGARTAAVGKLVDDPTVEDIMLDAIGGAATGRTTDVTRGSDTVTSAITEPVKIYAPVISVFTGDPMVLHASVTMRIE